jgi:hypothetical protein
VKEKSERKEKRIKEK